MLEHSEISNYPRNKAQEIKNSLNILRIKVFAMNDYISIIFQSDSLVRKFIEK